MHRIQKPFFVVGYFRNMHTDNSRYLKSELLSQYDNHVIIETQTWWNIIKTDSRSVELMINLKYSDDSRIVHDIPSWRPYVNAREVKIKSYIKYVALLLISTIFALLYNIGNV